jgi:hypothetical protein
VKNKAVNFLLLNHKKLVLFYVNAVLGSSGINLNQAKTCVYYAITTYMLDKLEQVAILVIHGPPATGKSSLLEAITKLVYRPKVVEAESIPTFRDKLAHAPQGNSNTVVIDEGHTVHEDYLIKRYAKNTAELNYKKKAGGHWEIDAINIFGATVIVRRTPFQDAATTSRSLFIRTMYKKGSYRVPNVSKARSNFRKIAHEVKLNRDSSERISNNWMPLQSVAKYLGDDEWLEYSQAEIERSTKALMGSQKYEPEQALLMVLRHTMITIVGGKNIEINDVQLSEIRNELKTEFDLHFKNHQIEEMCRALGFKIKIHSGYPRVKCDHELLEKQLKERSL